MPKLETKLNVRSAEFKANAQAMQALVEDLRLQCERVAQGGGEQARATRSHCRRLSLIHI